MTRTGPTTPAGIGADVADREPLDGVCSRGTDRVFLATSLGICIRGMQEDLRGQAMRGFCTKMPQCSAIRPRTG